ncbi:MAG: hypothetical protein GXP56_00990 [Deltaproteobacteria bacterium]|nr:hypothetical protein [Deltaproteobacteria bacterium]
MRIDASDSIQAKSLIDKSVYAMKYAVPDMGTCPGEKVIQSKTSTGILKYNKAGTKLWELGYRRIYYSYTSSNRLELFRLPAVKPFYNKDPVYLLGWIASFVGDPLYKLSGRKLKKKAKLFVSEVKLISLSSESDNVYPPMAQMKIRPQNRTGDMEYICPTFEAMPYVTVKNDDLKKYKIWEFSFMDPFGKETKKTVNLGKLKLTRI